MRIKNINGSYTVEAALVMTVTVFVIASVIVFSMFLHSRVCAAADLRRSAEEKQIEAIKSGELVSVKTAETGKNGVKITENSVASYNETVEKTYINVPKSLRIMRMINLISEDD